MDCERSSLGQIKCAFGGLVGVCRSVIHHIKRHTGLYGFVSGVFSTVAILVCVIWYGILAYPLPWKVVDPTDTRFDPMQFRFSDYDSGSDKGRVYACLFPKGTDKSFVDKILVDVAGAGVKKISIKNEEYHHPNEYQYTYSTSRSKIGHMIHSLVSEDKWFTIRFDVSNKVQDATFLKYAKCEKENVNDK